MLSPPAHPIGFIEPCLPTPSRTVPDGPRWAFEIKHDGFRFIARRDDDRVRVFSRQGKDWTGKVPAIVEAMLALDGDHLRSHPWEIRRATLTRLLRKAHSGVRLSEHLNGDGETIFRHACALGAEGIVAKRRDRPYQSGRCADWVKIKNPDAPAATRVIER
jgi:bifunctional non-homologous end joining protein LigD